MFHCKYGCTTNTLRCMLLACLYRKYGEVVMGRVITMMIRYVLYILRDVMILAGVKEWEEEEDTDDDEIKKKEEKGRR